MVANRAIDTFIYNTQFLIDEEFGLEALAKYFHDLYLIESGATPKELGYKNKISDNVSIICGEFVDQYTNSNNIKHGSIAKINLSGVMRMDSGLCNMGIQELSDSLHQLDSNQNVKGFLFSVHSGGGEATSGIHLYNTIKDLSKPSVAHTHTMASAAYLAMLPVNEMIAQSTMSRIGSIGAMVSIDKKLIDYYKNNIQDIYSSKSTNKNSEIRSFLESGDTSKIVKSLDKTVSEFHSKVLAHRTLPDATKEDTLTGHLFDAHTAKSRGLIDSIGGQNYAIKRLNHYINLSKH